jgi:hypothetical protein
MPYVMCKTLGRMGRLGNQMFQYALLLGVSARTGHTPTLPLRNKSDRETENLILDTVFSINVPDCSHLVADKRIHEPHFSYSSIVESISVEQGNVDFHGYFQTEKYFKHAEKEVRASFTFKDPNLLLDAACVVEQARKTSDIGVVVSIHVRRGDYLHLAHCHPFSDQYYKTAVENISARLGGKCHFLVVSDDISWCKQFFGSMSALGKFSYSDGNMFQDLAIMRSADHCIIANSSFSWWGAWLNNNPNKIVVAPKRWFNHSCPQDWHDIYCNGWIVC